MNKVQATKALKGGALDELEEDDDQGPAPVLEMDFTVVDMGMHFVEVDQTPLEEDQVLAVFTFHGLFGGVGSRYTAEALEASLSSQSMHYIDAAHWQRARRNPMSTTKDQLICHA